MLAGLTLLILVDSGKTLNDGFNPTEE